MLEEFKFQHRTSECLKCSGKRRGPNAGTKLWRFGTRFRTESEGTNNLSPHPKADPKLTRGASRKATATPKATTEIASERMSEGKKYCAGNEDGKGGRASRMCCLTN